MTDFDSTAQIARSVALEPCLTCRIDGATLVFVGEADLSTVDTIAASVDGAEGGGDVTVDLSGVTFMDSSGLRALLDARTRLADQGRRLTVGAFSTPVGRLFEITGLSDVFDVAQ